MRPDPREGAIGTLVTALVALGLLGAALLTPWYHYDFSTGRQSAPDGPYSDDLLAEHRTMEYHAFAVEGDTEPSDAAAAETATERVGYLVVAALILCGLAVLGEVPLLRRYIRRMAVVSMLAVAVVALLAAAWIAWYVFPDTMAGQGVNDAYTHELDEPEGYTRTGIGIGWIAAMLSTGFVIAAGLFKYRAGTYDPGHVEVYRA